MEDNMTRLTSKFFFLIFVMGLIMGSFSNVLYPSVQRIVSGDAEWRVITSGTYVQRIVTTPQQGSVWGVLIPDSPARWMYADNFNTGPVREQAQWIVKTFRYDFGSLIPYNHVVHAYIRIAADNGYVLKVSGYELGRTFFPNNLYENKPIFPVDWHRVDTYDIKPYWGMYSNYIEIDVADYGALAGLLVDVYFELDY
jgi:hypothetical protein